MSCRLAKILARIGPTNQVSLRLKDIVQRTIEHREKHGVMRKDLLQLLIQLRNTGKISDDNDEIWSIESTADNLKSMSIEMITAQMFLFYVAGSETTAATTSFTLYEMAMYPEILKKAQAEVDECLNKHNIKPDGKYTYESIKDMKYLDLCVTGTLFTYVALVILRSF